MTAASEGTSPASAQCSAIGHQSRLASATAATSLTADVTSQIDSNSVTNSGLTVTRALRRCEENPVSSIGAVGRVVISALSVVLFAGGVVATSPDGGVCLALSLAQLVIIRKFATCAFEAPAKF